MKVKFIICALLLIGFIWHTDTADQQKRAIAICVERGVQHFKDTRQYPYVTEGLVKYLARDVAQSRCQRNPGAF